MPKYNRFMYMKSPFRLHRACGLLLLFILFLMGLYPQRATSQNPYLPLWEFIPDGEPYVFEDPDQPGKYRVYIYGSHDMLRNAYCGYDLVVWSAPVDTLTAWRYDGVIFELRENALGQPLHASGRADLLYAPDVTLRIDSQGNKHYYLYPNDMETGRRHTVAHSDRPDGPFRVTNWSDSDPFQTVGTPEFDPAAFVDSDERAYAYWGYEESWGGELEADMANVKPETAKKDLIPSCKQDSIFRFFEASSMRKIGDFYVLVYSRVTREGEFGLHSSNYTLAYAYSKNPLGPFRYGGTLIDGRGRGTNPKGQAICTAYPYGNTHGSLCEINGQWWVFYHRQTGTDEFARQAMVAPVEVAIRADSLIISEGELTSEGFRTEGLSPLDTTAAAYACYLWHPVMAKQVYPNLYFAGPYIGTRIPELASVEHCTNGSVVGYKYFNWDGIGQELLLMVDLQPEGVNGMVHVLVGDEPYEAVEVARLPLSQNMAQQRQSFTVPCHLPADLKGKKALYFVFNSEEKERSICRLFGFVFREK